MKLLSKACILAALVSVLCSCDGRQSRREESAARAEMARMSVKQKVGQMFVIHPEDLMGDGEEWPCTALSAGMRAANDSFPCGGVILFADNIVSPEQIKAFTDSLHSLPSAPLIYVDEEGGRVARIGNNPAFNVPRFPAMGLLHDSAEAEAAGVFIGRYLKEYGFDVDLAPVADVNSNPANPVIGTRSFSSDPDSAAARCTAFLRGLRKSGIEGCLKHFPGHGDTSTDSHLGQAESLKSWEEMLGCEMIPFKAGIADGVRLIMTAHIGTPNVNGGDLPATMSEVILRQKLRGELGYRGLIITDGMGMKAVSARWEPSQAAVSAIKAGADLILCPKDYPSAFEGVMSALDSGEITMERLDSSVLAILKFKALLRMPE